MALIELDLTAQPDPTLAARPPARGYRIPGLVIAALLAVVLGGAAPVTPTLWHYLGVVPPAAAAEGQFRLVGDRVYTVRLTGDDRITTAWQIADPPRRLWTVRFPARVSGPDDVGFGGVEARAAGDEVLLSDGPATTVVDAATGAVRWRTSVGVTPLRAGLGLTQTSVFRPGTEYDQDSGDPGALYFSSTGVPHIEPPLRTEVHGVDLRTGRTVWTAVAPGAVNVFVAGGDVLVLASDRLQRIDGGTGAIRRTAGLPRIDGAGPLAGSLVAGTVVVSYGNTDTGGQEIGYDAGTLDRRWQRPVPAVFFDPPACTALLCAGPRAALDVLDPVTGTARWRAPDRVDLIARAGYVLEVDPGSGLPLRLADPATGADRVDLTGWRSEIGEGDVLVLRRPQNGGASAFGVVLHDRDRIQVLGVSGGPVSDCTAGRAYVMCRAGDGLRLWAFHS